MIDRCGGEGGGGVLEMYEKKKSDDFAEERSRFFFGLAWLAYLFE